MKKEEYYEESRKNKLPLRCPIIGKCERYAQTIFHLSELYIYGDGKTLEDKLRNGGYLTDDYEENKVSQIGEAFRLSKSRTCYTMAGACPEVSLFDSEGTLSSIPGKAIVSGEWDQLRSSNEFGEDRKFQVLETRHYSKCSEFSNYHYEKKVRSSKRTTKTSTKPKISKMLRFEILQRDNFTCQYCKRNKEEDGVKLHVDHIVPTSKGGSDHMKNLVTSCQDCNLGKSNKIV